MKARIGCSIQNRPGEVFVQLVEPGRIFEGKVISSAMAETHEAALAKAMGYGGVTEIITQTFEETYGWPRGASLQSPRPRGVRGAMDQLGRELDALGGSMKCWRSHLD